MKSLIILLCTISVYTCYSQSNAYKESMKKCVAQFNTSTNRSDFLKVAKAFETIANTEKKEWLPFYYAGLCQAIAAFESDKTAIDALCDKGDRFAKTADSLSPSNSEVHVLNAMLAAARIMVNEKQRGQKYGVLSSKYANSAIKLNNSNPRAYLLKGRALLHTPELFGGGTKKAKPFFEKALEKYKIAKPESAIVPSWGADQAEKELKAINEPPKK